MDIKRMSKQELDELNERAKRWREAQEAQKPTSSVADASPVVNTVQAEFLFESP
jgi:hypothetical protein